MARRGTLGKSRKCCSVRKKSVAEAKLLCSLHCQNSPALLGTFLHSTDTYSSIFSPSHGLHLELFLAGTLWPESILALSLTASDHIKEALTVPCCWHLTSSPSLFLGLFQLKSSHLTSIHRLFCSWISHGFDLRAYELIPLELLMEKIVFSVVLYKAKSTDSTAQLNTAISLQLQGELNTQQCQIISSRVFPLDICRCKWDLLDTFCLSNHRLATTTAELTIISPSALRYL